MGLFGGGNSSSTSNTSVQNYEATNAPQSSQAGAAGTLGVTISPQLVGSGTFGAIDTNSYNAPLYITTSDNEGDDAIQAAQQTAQAAVQASAASGNAGNSSTTTTPSWVSSLFSGDNLYYIIGAVVLLMITRGHAR